MQGNTNGDICTSLLGWGECSLLLPSSAASQMWVEGRGYGESFRF